MADVRRPMRAPGASPEDIARAGFPTAFRGYEIAAVRGYLTEIASVVAELRGRVAELEASATSPAPAPTAGERDLMVELGQEAARVLAGARDAAADMRAKAEESAARTLREAQEEADRMRSEAETVLAARTEEAERAAAVILDEASASAEATQGEADARAEAVLAEARERGERLVEEARAQRERVIGELTRRKRVLKEQLDMLREARDRVGDHLREARTELDDLAERLARPMAVPPVDDDLVTPPAGQPAVSVQAPTAASAPAGEATSAAAGDAVAPGTAAGDGAPEEAPAGGAPIDAVAAAPAAAAAAAEPAPPALVQPIEAALPDGSGTVVRIAAPHAEERLAHLADGTDPDAGSAVPDGAAGEAAPEQSPAEAADPGARRASSALRIIRPGDLPPGTPPRRAEPAARLPRGEADDVEGIRILGPAPKSNRPAPDDAELAAGDADQADGAAAVAAEAVAAAEAAPADPGSMRDRPAPARLSDRWAVVEPPPPVAGGVRVLRPAADEAAPPVTDSSPIVRRSPAPTPAPPAAPAPEAPAAAADVAAVPEDAEDVGAVATDPDSERTDPSEPEDVAEPEVAEASADAEPERPGRDRPKVDELFARIKADRAKAVEAAERVLSTPPPPTEGSLAVAPRHEHEPKRSPAPRSEPAAAPERKSEPAAVPVAQSEPAAVPVAQADPAIADEALLQRRDTAVEPLEAAMVRRVKRAFQDEQNDVLDRLRTLRGPATVDAVLPALDERRARLRAAVQPQLAEVAAAGVAFAASVLSGDAAGAAEGPPPVDEIADGLAGDLASAAGERLERAIAQASADELDASGIADRLGHAYREARSRIEGLVGSYAISAHAAGVLSAGAPVRWIVDDGGDPCSDCEDDALAGDVDPGSEFPTGQLHPPAHAGCRCLLVPART